MVILFHFFLGILLFFVVNLIGKNSIQSGYMQMSIIAKTDEAPVFNFIFKAFTPTVYIVILSSIFYKLQWDILVSNIFLVVIFYYAFRLVFNLFTGRGRHINWLNQLFYWITAIPFSLYIYNEYIFSKEFLFPTSKEIGSALWLAIVAYIYKTFNQINISNKGTIKRKRKYLAHRYKMYTAKYGAIISAIVENKEQEAIVYSILIYEAFNRPKLYRLIENTFFYLNLSKTLGIMQVNTDRIITDKDSVTIGTKKIVVDFNNEYKKLPCTVTDCEVNWLLRRAVFSLYNKDDNYVDEVEKVYTEIKSLFYQ